MTLKSNAFPLLRRGLGALLVLLPALVLWTLVEDYRFEVPQFDELAFIEFKLKAGDSETFSWEEALGFHNEHRVVVTRLIYAGIYHLTHGDLDVFTKITFFLAVFVAAGLIYLGRRTWRGEAAGGLVPLATTLLVFTPAAVYAWQSNFIFGNFIPWVCLVGGMLLLHSRTPSSVAIPLLALLAVGATFSFAMGLLLFVLFPIHAWMVDRVPSGKGRWIAGGAWFVVAAASIFLAIGAASERLVETSDRPRGLALILQDPLHALGFFFQMLGAPLGLGTAIPFGILAGTVGFLVVAVWVGAAWLTFRRWKESDLAERRGVAVWLTLGAAAIASAALVTLGRVTQSGVLAESPHYIVTCVYGLVSASALLFHFRAVIGRRVVAGLFGGLLLLGVINGYHGAGHMKLWKSESLRIRASITFMNLFEREDFPLLNLIPGTWEITQRLLDEGYIAVVQPATGYALADYKVLSPLKPNRGRFTAINAYGRATGYSELQVKDGELPRVADAVLFAWAPLDGGENETLFDIAFPERVEGYYRSPREVKQRGDYFNGWKKVLALGRLPAGEPVRIRAYAYDVLTARLRAIPGAFEFRDGKFTPQDSPASSR